MTTPPDTPKPPAELWMLPDPDDGRPRIANKQQIGSVRYILAPSPQESHKLAEELERHSRSCDRNCRQYTAELCLRAAQALRSSPSEQTSDARDAFVVRFYTEDEGPTIKGNGFDGLRVGNCREEAEEFVRWINAAIAASGGAQT